MIEVDAAGGADALAVRGAVEAGGDREEEFLADVVGEVDLQVADFLEMETEVLDGDHGADVVQAACAGGEDRDGGGTGHDEIGAGHHGGQAIGDVAGGDERRDRVRGQPEDFGGFGALEEIRDVREDVRGIDLDHERDSIFLRTASTTAGGTNAETDPPQEAISRMRRELTKEYSGLGIMKRVSQAAFSSRFMSAI